MKTILRLVLYGFLTYFIFSCTASLTDTTPPTPAQAKQNQERQLRIDLLVRSEQLVERYLKDPDSATFSSLYETKISVLPPGQDDDFRYFVEGWVRSSNSYGGMVRANYQVAYNSSRRPIAMSIGSKEWRFQ